MKDFAGRVAVVTGAGSGIGLGLATRFAQEGMKVVMADIEAPVLRASVTHLRRQEYDVLGVVTDVSSGASIEALRDKTLEAYGKVHILCNNAGVSVSSASPDIWGATEKDWQWGLGVNLWGVIHGVRAFLPVMLEHGEEGHVVNTSSNAGLVSISGGVYGVTKHAVVSLSEGLFHNLQRTGSKLHCSVLCPNVTNTNISHASRNRPDELIDDGASRDLTPVARARADHIKAILAQGMAPDELADIVLDAIREEQFWILADKDTDDSIRARMESILNRTNPIPMKNPFNR